MKTETRSRIEKIVREKGRVRPVELIRELGLTGQAIHRHLRALVASGTLESQGRGPKTYYVLAGVPQWKSLKSWYASARPSEGPVEFRCLTRDVFTARLSQFSGLTRKGLREADLSLLISLAGEVGNNCFDHNLGQWGDQPGCWFEIQVTGKWLWIGIADRGQGIYSSLRRADPKISNDQEALRAAFERTLSGRAPENRGNGLKFVRHIVMGDEGRGLACRSGGGLIDYGQSGGMCRKELEAMSSRHSGTLTVVAWRIK